MNRCYTDKEGHTFRVFSTMYIDWGLEITGPSGEELFYSPSALSNESYGYKMNPDRNFVDWEEAEQEQHAGDEQAFVPWDEEDWKECLSSQSDELLDAYTVICVSCEKTINHSSAVLAGTEFFCAGCENE